MYYIVESKDQFEKFSKRVGWENGYVGIIMNEDDKHPIISELCSLYIKDINTDIGIIIPINHPETLQHDIDIELVLNNYNNLFTIDGKLFRYFFPNIKINDINIINLLKNSEGLKNNINTSSHLFFINKEIEDYNHIIPISKHFEKQENIYNNIKKYIDYDIIKTQTYQIYNIKYIDNLFNIEKNGIKIESTLPINKPEKSTYKNYLFTKYNYSITSRPTTNFNGFSVINLPKDDSRKNIIPRNSKLLEIDYDAYHIRIICDLIGYELKTDNIHNYLSEIYFKSSEISEEQYLQSKQITFKQIYGGILDEYKDIEPFRSINEFTLELWKEFNSNGYISDPITGLKFSSNLENMYPQKLLSYLLQSLETSNNIIIINNLIKFLKNKKTKLILYSYDAFLFDYDESEDIIDDLKKIIEKNNFKSKIKIGKNYGELK